MLESTTFFKGKKHFHLYLSFTLVPPPPPPYASLSLSLSLQKHVKIMKGKFLKVCLSKCQKMGIRVVPCLCCCQWPLWSLMQEEKYSTPRDVPKVHLVVYVDEDCERHVIKITLLKHPLFRALLDQARDQEYDMRTSSSLMLRMPVHLCTIQESPSASFEG